jgi:hypothetical protein
VVFVKGLTRNISAVLDQLSSEGWNVKFLQAGNVPGLVRGPKDGAFAGSASQRFSLQFPPNCYNQVTPIQPA